MAEYFAFSTYITPHTLIPDNPRAIWKASFSVFSNLSMFTSILSTMDRSKDPVPFQALQSITGTKGWPGTVFISSANITIAEDPAAANAVHVSMTSFVGEFIICKPWDASEGCWANDSVGSVFWVWFYYWISVENCASACAEAANISPGGQVSSQTGQQEYN